MLEVVHKQRCWEKMGTCTELSCSEFLDAGHLIAMEQARDQSRSGRCRLSALITDKGAYAFVTMRSWWEGRGQGIA
jgi:hypothetical protein